MAQRRFDAMRAGWPALALVLCTAATAAPLRLSLDTVAATGPTGEVAGPTPARQPDAEAEVELSFAGSQELDFPDTATPAAGIDDDWMATTRPVQDEAAASADRDLGGFVPPTPDSIVATADPYDQVQLPAPAVTRDVSRQAEPDLPALARGREALAWIVAPIVALAVAVAWLTGRHGSRRRRRGAAAA
jgi:hypothetical protein